MSPTKARRHPRLVAKSSNAKTHRKALNDVKAVSDYLRDHVDPKEICHLVAEELRFAVDVTNLLRCAIQHHVDYWTRGVTSPSRLVTYLDALRANLLSPFELASKVPLETLVELRYEWEAELLAVSERTAKIDGRRIIQRARRTQARHLLDVGDRAGVKRDATLMQIAETLKVEGKDKIRQVRKLLSERKKARGGIFDLDPSLLRGPAPYVEDFEGVLQPYLPEPVVTHTTRSSTPKGMTRARLKP